MNGGDDETRTRDLCRDSERFLSTCNDLQEHGRHPKSLQDSLRHRFCVPRCVPRPEVVLAHSGTGISKNTDTPIEMNVPLPILRASDALAGALETEVGSRHIKRLFEGDAAESAPCGYMAWIALAGLMVNAVWNKSEERNATNSRPLPARTALCYRYGLGEVH